MSFELNFLKKNFFPLPPLDIATGSETKRSTQDMSKYDMSIIRLYRYNSYIGAIGAIGAIGCLDERPLVEMLDVN
jgi:hypothetical protein